MMIRSPGRLSLAALSLLVTLPFLDPRHFLPIPTFRQEWLAIALGIAVIALLLLDRNESPWEIPRSALFPPLLGGLLWIQHAAGGSIRLEYVIVASLCLGWAGMLMVATCRLERLFGFERVADLLSWALLAGALAQAATGALQLWAPWIGLPLIFPGHGAMQGNLAQANAFADYLWLGIAGALALHSRQRIGTAALAAALIPLTACTLLSGSRSVYFYAAALAGWSLVAAWQRQNGAEWRRLIIGAAMIAIAVVVLPEVPTFGGTTVSSAQRLTAQGSYDPVRLTLWRAAIDIFLDHPWLGAGFDSYPREFFARIDRFPINGIGIPEHSHNLVTQFAAGLGLAGLIFLAVALAFWTGGAKRRWRESSAFPCFAVLLVLGIHSNLEYPLWYVHFMAIAAIALALADGNRFLVSPMRRHRTLGLIVLAGSLAALVSLRGDYLTLEDAAAGYAANGSRLTAEAQQVLLIDAHRRTIWRSYAALQFAGRMPIDGEAIEARLALMEEAVTFSPIREAVFRYAALLALAGHPQAALEQLQRAMLAYPQEIGNASRMYGASGAEPALRPLLEELRQRSF